MVQWLRICTPSVGGMGFIPGWELRSHMLHDMAKKKKKKKIGYKLIIVEIAIVVWYNSYAKRIMVV